MGLPISLKSEPESLDGESPQVNLFAHQIDKETLAIPFPPDGSVRSIKKNIARADSRTSTAWQLAILKVSAEMHWSGCK